MQFTSDLYREDLRGDRVSLLLSYNLLIKLLELNCWPWQYGSAIYEMCFLGISHHPSEHFGPLILHKEQLLTEMVFFYLPLSRVINTQTMMINYYCEQIFLWTMNPGVVPLLKWLSLANPMVHLTAKCANQRGHQWLPFLHFLRGA